MIKSEKGITLVEILAVLIILGLIMHFLTLRFETFTQSVERDVIESDFRVAKTSITQYYLDKRDLPDGEEELERSIGFDITEIDEQDGVRKYETKNKKDTWNNPYLLYVYLGDADNSPYFAMISLGPDGKKSSSIDNPEDDVIYIFYPTK